MDGASGTWLAADRASDAPAVRPPALTGSRPDRLTAVSCVSSCGDVERQSAGRIRNFSTRAHVESPLGCWNGRDTLTKRTASIRKNTHRPASSGPGSSPAVGKASVESKSSWTNAARSCCAGVTAAPLPPSPPPGARARLLSVAAGSRLARSGSCPLLRIAASCSSSENGSDESECAPSRSRSEKTIVCA
jgi:hypothetical protein